MATITPVSLHIGPSTQVGQSLVTVNYNVIFDNFDMISNKPYHTHVDLVGDDANEPLEGGTRVIYGWGTGDICPAMCLPNLNVLLRVSQFTVPDARLNEDAGPGHVDEIRARVTLATPDPVVVGPVNSLNLVTLALG
jgi:hypothetical protein